MYDGQAGLGQLPLLRAVYAEVYTEPPYCEGESDVNEFAEGWAWRCGRSGFRLVIENGQDGPAGFAFGHLLRAGTTWWDGLMSDVPDELTAEWPGRTFAIIELAVRPAYRRHGVATALHSALLQGVGTERVALLCRPEAEAAQATYAAFGYRRIGPLRSNPEAPFYDAMLLDL